MRVTLSQVGKISSTEYRSFKASLRIFYADETKLFDISATQQVDKCIRARENGENAISDIFLQEMLLNRVEHVK